MTGDRATPKSLARRLRGLPRDEGGATAVEFSLVALPFFAIMFAIIETALIFWAGQVLETALTEATRKIYTGQFQAENADPSATSEASADKFREEICRHVVALFPCNSLVKVDVRRFATSFPEEGLRLPITDGAFDSGDFRYESSGPSDIVVVRAAMEYPTMLGLIHTGQSNLSSGNRLIMSTAAFRNEPYSR